jgi:hypothetical protein
MAISLAVLGLAACNALPTLIEAWSNDLYARGGSLAFGIWLAPQGFLFLKKPHFFSGHSGLAWVVASLLLVTAGSMTGMRALQHLALACAFSGLLGSRLVALAALAAAPAWLPATGWFVSHWMSGGLAGWERPTFAALMALVLLVLARLPIAAFPSHRPSP